MGERKEEIRSGKFKRKQKKKTARAPQEHKRPTRSNDGMCSDSNSTGPCGGPATVAAASRPAAAGSHDKDLPLPTGLHVHCTLQTCTPSVAAMPHSVCVSLVCCVATPARGATAMMQSLCSRLKRDNAMAETLLYCRRCPILVTSTSLRRQARSLQTRRRRRPACDVHTSDAGRQAAVASLVQTFPGTAGAALCRMFCPIGYESSELPIAAGGGEVGIWPCVRWILPPLSLASLLVAPAPVACRSLLVGPNDACYILRQLPPPSNGCLDLMSLAAAIAADIR